jgi:hypothetical protein
VDRFVATRSIEKGKTVGRPPVNDEIVEDLRQRMEQNSKKNPLGSYHFRLMYLPLSTCQKIVRKNTRWHPIKVGVWIAASRRSLIAFIVKIKEPVINEVT